MQQETALSPISAVTEAAGHGAHSEADAMHQTQNRKFAMWLFIASEVMFFTVLIAGFLIIRFQYPDEHTILNIPLTSLNTFLLLMSSYLVVRALAGIQQGDQIKLQRSLLGVLVLGIIFLGVQVYEYDHLGHEGLTLSSSPFGMAFYTLTGFHGLHVLIGVIWTLLVFNNAFNGKYTKENHFGVEFYGLYWHFVDVVWIFVFTLAYLI
jgi:heme/copper-type cytochrome/quinol oxidase subunit 3